ncbi:hypothetical protein Tco_1482330 [Tanacetum coccineum]
MLSSLGTQLKKQQDEVINKINTLWKVVLEKFDNAPTHGIAKNSMVQANVVSHDPQGSGELPNKGIIKNSRRERESSDIGNDDKTSDLEEEVRKDETELGKEEEGMEYDQRLDLVDVHDESVYESLTEKMSSWIMSYVMDFTILENVEANIDP